MEFELLSAAQYRAMDTDALNKRRDAIAAEFENVESKIKTEDLLAESKRCQDEYERRNAAAQIRSANIAAIAGGAGRVIERSANHTPNGAAQASVAQEDPHDTAEYRSAFVDLVNRGIETRTDAITLTTDAPVAIPTTLSNDIIEKLDFYGDIYPLVTKTSFQGGYEIPIDSFDFTAAWVGEQQISDWQKAERNQKITFNYHEFESRVMWSFLSGIVTFDNFTGKFQPKMSKAITKLLEQGIFTGTGTGQMLGILNDPRVVHTVEMTEADFKNWKAWHSILDADIDPEYDDGNIFMSKGSWNKYIDTMSDNNNAPVNYAYDPVTGKRSQILIGKQTNLVKPNFLPDFDKAEAGDVVGVYGDMRNYVINWQPGGGITIMRYPDYDKRQNKLFGYGVCDGKVADPYGFILIKKKASA